MMNSNSEDVVDAGTTDLSLISNNNPPLTGAAVLACPLSSHDDNNARFQTQLERSVSSSSFCEMSHDDDLTQAQHIPCDGDIDETSAAGKRKEHPTLSVSTASASTSESVTMGDEQVGDVSPPQQESRLSMSPSSPSINEHSTEYELMRSNTMMLC